MKKSTAKETANFVPSAVITSIQTGYIHALEVTADDELEGRGPTRASVKETYQVCREFAIANSADVLRAIDMGMGIDDVGINLFLTSQGHGTGFWDRKLELFNCAGDPDELKAEFAEIM